MSQSDSPFAPLFAWIGISGVSFVMVAVVAMAVEAARLPAATIDLEKPTHVGTRLARTAIPVVLILGLLLIPAWPVSTSGTMRVAAVQGNGKAGYFDEREDGDLLRAQVDATAPLFGDDVDVLLWPEGSTERSPLTDQFTADAFDYVSERMDAPLVGWAVTERDGRTYNTVLLWQAGEGALDYYDKRHPVPFGEYIPDRAFWRPFAPELIDLVGREYTPGSTDMVMEVNMTTVGVNICFDIVDDQILNDSVRQGAEVIFASSNNADFGRTDESAQQLAIAQIRAIELGRSVVNISTVGLSAVIAPDGRIVAQLPWYTAATMVEDVELSQTITPATLGSRQLEWFVSAFSLAALGIAFATTRGRRTERGARG